MARPGSRGATATTARSGALHVAALPYPSPQGTQAAIGAMLDALVDAGREARLLTYAGGAGAAPSRFEIVRLPHGFGDRSLRSGPSIAKLAQDVALAREIARARPSLVIAHHVEAASAALLSGARPIVFVAHTALGPELPTYLPRFARALAPLASGAGAGLDRALARRADAVLAVSPKLAQRIATEAGVDARWLPVPWPVPPPIEARERSDARHALGLYPDDEVLLYAGNLDRYQGLGSLLDAHARVAARRPRLRLLIATASDAGALALPRGARVVPLERSEPQRRALHAAADAVVVTRAAEGGLPIKLIDALARGVPVACVRRATAGLSLHGCAAIAPGDDLGASIDALLRAPGLGRELADAGRAWVSRELAPARFLAALDDAIARAAPGLAVAAGRRTSAASSSEEDQR
jgi:glycosyltransferase involved in cell wall biosynthesis